MFKTLIISTLYLTVSFLFPSKVSLDFNISNELDSLALLIDQGSKNYKVFNRAAELSYLMDDMDGTGKYYKSALEKCTDPKQYDLIKGKFESLKELQNELKLIQKTRDSGSIEQSLEEYKVLLNAYPDNSLIFYLIGITYQKLRDLDNAGIYFIKSREQKPYVEKYSNAVLNISKNKTKSAITLFKRGKINESIKELKSAIDIDPGYVTAYEKLAYIYNSSKVKEYDKSISLLSSYSNIERQPKILYYLGDSYQKKGLYEDAVNSYLKAVGIDQNYTKAYYQMGLCYNSLGKADEAINFLLNAIEINPDYSKAHETLAKVYLSKGKYENSIESYNNAIKTIDKKGKKNLYKIYTYLSDACIVYGESLSENNNLFKDAKRYAYESISLKQNNPQAYYYLGLAELHLCNQVAAEEALTRAKKDRQFKSSATNYLKNITYYLSEFGCK